MQEAPMPKVLRNYGENKKRQSRELYGVDERSGRLFTQNVKGKDIKIIDRLSENLMSKIVFRQSEHHSEVGR